jgi:metallophosphoesterase (TIGR00282 family)
MTIVRAAMIGDVVGVQGLETLEAALPVLIREQHIDFVTVNGENAADGFGMTEKDFRRIIAAGADAVTSGNHVWEKREFWPVLESEKNMLRPANYPAPYGGTHGTADAPRAPGTGIVRIEKNNIVWVVINLQGREFMSAIDCPFQCFDRCLEKAREGAAGRPPVVLLDFHAESSREKEALAYYADGRASLIAGTHTHVQTADERILPKGSAYITDLGMTGADGGVIGMDPEICLERAYKQVLYHMETAPAQKPGQMHGVIAEINADDGTAVSIKRI